MVGNHSLRVELRQQLARLQVRGWFVGIVAAQHELTRQIPGDQELRLSISVLQNRCPARDGPRPKPTQVSVQLALDVMVTVAAGLDDEPCFRESHFQDSRLHLPPAVIPDHAQAREPLVQQRPLARR